jgi:hypothetical protein
MSRIERARLRTGRNLIYRATLLSMLVSAGCSDYSGVGSSIRRWWQSAGGAPTASGRSDHAADVSASGERAESAGDVSPQRAAAEALAASRKAQTAATAAVQASKEAIAASKMAVKAAAQNGDGSIPAPVTNGVSEPSTEATVPAINTPLTLSPSGETGSDKSRAETADLLHKLEQSYHQVDGSRLQPNDASRRDLAGKLLQSAQKAFDQSNYAEADGLARKASVMLAPLVGSSPD